MIYTRDYEDLLKSTAKEFFVSDVKYIDDLQSWSKGAGCDLSEPLQPLKLVAEGDNLILFIQSEIPDNTLDNVITGMGIRWSLRDNMSDPSKRLNSVKKRLAYCLLKECARTIPALGGDELLEDDWAMRQMEKLGFFLE